MGRGRLRLSAASMFVECAEICDNSVMCWCFYYVFVKGIISMRYYLSIFSECVPKVPVFVVLSKNVELVYASPLFRSSSNTSMSF